jgi:nucleoside-diphosphate-sugar epimerase
MDLVTGGSGFIGSPLVEELVRREPRLRARFLALQRDPVHGHR